VWEQWGGQAGGRRKGKWKRRRKRKRKPTTVKQQRRAGEQDAGAAGEVERTGWSVRAGRVAAK